MVETSPLRQRILDTARDLLEGEGLAGLSLREVARRAGVTHQAPYHHFGDRETILAELVADGFDELALRLESALEGATTARQALQGSFEAYVGFAIDRPGVFRIMFRPELCDPQRFPRAQAAGDRAYAALQAMVRRLHGTDDAAQTLASVYWGQVHGLACLLVDGPLAQRLPTPALRLAHLRQVSDRLLGLLDPQDPTRFRTSVQDGESALSKGE